MLEERGECMEQSRKKRRIVSVVFELLLSVCFVAGMVHYFGEGKALWRETTVNVALFCGSMVLFRAASGTPRRIRVNAAIYAFLYAAAMFVGKVYYDGGGIRRFLRPDSALLKNGISIIGFTAVFGALFALIWKLAAQFAGDDAVSTIQNAGDTAAPAEQVSGDAEAPVEQISGDAGVPAEQAPGNAEAPAAGIFAEPEYRDNKSLENSLAGERVKLRRTRGWKKALLFLLLWALLFLAWFPIFLAYFPGVASYDLYPQTEYALGIKAYTKYHPPLHTFLWQLCLMAGNATGFEAVSIYAVGQMLLMSAVCARTLLFIRAHRLPLFVRFLSLVWFALNPVIAIFSIIPVKDVVFGCFLLLFTMEIQTMLEDTENYLHSEWCCTRLILCALLASLFRNNAFYAIAVFFLLLVLFLRRHHVKALVLTALFVIFYLVINDGLYPALGVQEGKAREMMSVPVQQIALTVVEEGDKLPDDLQDEIDQFLPVDKLASRYNARLADPCKNLLEDDFDRGAFLQLWLRLMKLYPEHYVNAFLNLNLPFWYPDAESQDPLSKKEYIETGVLHMEDGYYSFDRDSKLPQVYEIYHRFENFHIIGDIPVVSVLFSIATPIWALLLCASILLARRRGREILTLVPAVLYWLTFLLGPVSCCRYVFGIMLMYPLLLALALNPMPQRVEAVHVTMKREEDSDEEMPEEDRQEEK